MDIGDYDLSIFVQPNEKVFNVELPIMVSKYHFEENVLNSREHMLAHIFKYLASFYKLIKNARENIGLEKVISYPKGITIDSYIEILNKLSLERNSILKSSVDTILRKYSLLDNWTAPLNVLILTHHLPTPHPNTPISYHIPLTKEEIKKNQERVKTLSAFAGARSLIENSEVLYHPAIYLNSKTSMTSLIKWIREHKYLIDAFNKSLKEETTTSTRITKRTLHVGELALIIKWDGTKKWSVMQKMIDEWDKQDDYEDYWGEEGRPTAEELRLAFKSFYQIASRLGSGGSESL